MTCQDILADIQNSGGNKITLEGTIFEARTDRKWYFIPDGCPFDVENGIEFALPDITAKPAPEIWSKAKREFMTSVDNAADLQASPTFTTFVTKFLEELYESRQSDFPNYPRSIDFFKKLRETEFALPFFNISVEDALLKLILHDNILEFTDISSQLIFLQSKFTPRTFEMKLYHPNATVCDAILVNGMLDVSSAQIKVNNGHHTRYFWGGDDQPQDIPMAIQETISAREILLNNHPIPNHTVRLSGYLDANFSEMHPEDNHARVFPSRAHSYFGLEQTVDSAIYVDQNKNIIDLYHYFGEIIPGSGGSMRIKGRKTPPPQPHRLVGNIHLVGDITKSTHPDYRWMITNISEFVVEPYNRRVYCYYNGKSS